MTTSLEEPLLGSWSWSAPASKRQRTVALLGSCRARAMAFRQRLLANLQSVRSQLANWFDATTDSAFIRSEINGRQSRRVVLMAFFITDVIGANLWASWCTSDDHPVTPGFGEPNACNTFGVNQYIVLVISLPIEGAALFLAGWRTWSFWSDGFLLPVWLIRLAILDVALWNSDPATLVGDALWFSVLAVMCRVHSLALIILVVTQVSSLYVVLGMHGYIDSKSFELVRYGHYNSVMLLGVAGAYITDELSRVRCFSQLAALQDTNSDLADAMIRWKVFTEDERQDKHSPLPPVGQKPWLGLGVPPSSRVVPPPPPGVRRAKSPDPSNLDGSSWSSGTLQGHVAALAATAEEHMGAQAIPEPPASLLPLSAMQAAGIAGATNLLNALSSSVNGKPPRSNTRRVWWGDASSSRNLVPTSQPRSGPYAFRRVPSGSKQGRSWQRGNAFLYQNGGSYGGTPAANPAAGGLRSSGTREVSGMLERKSQDSACASRVSGASAALEVLDVLE